MTTIGSSPEPTHYISYQWSKSRFPTIQSSFSLCQRIEFIIEKLKSENWLPSSLKDAIRKRCASILCSHLDGTLGPDKAKSLIEELAAATYAHEELTLHSSTLCQIRTLDLELHDELEDVSSGTVAV